MLYLLKTLHGLCPHENIKLYFIFTSIKFVKYNYVIILLDVKHFQYLLLQRPGNKINIYNNLRIIGSTCNKLYLKK